MFDKNEKSRCLASLAVFRELYDSEHDVYGILAEFLKTVIQANKLTLFSLREITDALNETFDFDIPQPVIKSAIKRLKCTTLPKGQYSCDLNKNQSAIDNVSRRLDEARESNDQLLGDLYAYIKRERNIEIDQAMKESISSSFCAYLLDEAILHEWSEYFSAFIIENKSDHVFWERLTKIKQGIILHTGLVYTPNPGTLGSWQARLDIYLDTENLFHLAGYNGELFKQMFDDFHTLVKEANAKAKKRLVQLKVFDETKETVDGFFTKAERLVASGTFVNPSTSAMVYIVKSCNSPSEVIQMKNAFYARLETIGITFCESADLTDKSKYKFNIENTELANELEEQFGDKRIHHAQHLLSQINVLRSGVSNTGFDAVRHILLTENNASLHIAWHPSVKQSGHVPLATNLHFMTNKFWFKLNKGFGNGDYPKSFDVITSAQMCLSSSLSYSIAETYKKTTRQYADGSITRDVVESTIAQLKTKAKIAEEIDEGNVDDLLSFIQEGSIEHLVLEQEQIAKRAEETDSQNRRILEELEKEKKARQDEHESHLSTSEELEELRAEKKREQNRKMRTRTRVRKVVVFLFGITLISGGVYLYITYNKIAGICITVLSTVLGILAFFGVGWTRMKSFLLK
jgi:hypothetical protein